MEFALRKWGFTIAELLVVIAIISVIGTYSLASFSRISDSKIKSSMESEISSLINQEDEGIESGQNQSYRILFESGAYGYSVEKDFYSKNDLVLLKFDYTSLTGALTNSSTSTGSWMVRSFVDNRFLGDFVRIPMAGSNISLSFSGLLFSKTTLLSSLEGRSLNSFSLFPLNDTTDGDRVRIKGFSGSYDHLIYQNVLWKKEIISYTLATSGTLDTASVIFDYKDEDIPLILTK